MQPNFRYRALPVTATQWLREGDHPAVTGCTRRWATENDNPAFIVDREYAEQYDKLGMIHIGSLANGVIVEAGDWIVEEDGEEIEVYDPKTFDKYFEQVQEAPVPVAVAVAVTPGPVDGEGTPVGVEMAPPVPESAPVANDPATVNPSPAPEA